VKHLAIVPLFAWIALGGIVVLGAAGVWGYRALDARLTAMASSSAELAQKNLALSDSLYSAQQGLAAVQERLGGFESTVGNLSGTLGTLEKLSKTDRELLQKYSKVYFLNEHYAPAELTTIDQEFTYSNTQAEQIATPVWPFLKNLFKDAKDDGVDLYAKSAYRSFDEQKSLKSAYTVTYGAGSANAFSADQGYSEHQLGTTLDFISPGQGGVLDGFENTKAYPWLQDNAYKYGFILSYPKGNAYYIYEPWHWRFVGVKLATYLHDKHKNFYDLEQREIDTYLADIFD
jgi:LAS superfamily LD-carboxypeptidase LdcB